MLSASMIFSCSGIIAHAERVKDKKQQYYQAYEKIIKEANEKIGSKDFELLPIDEINEDEMLTPKEFQKTVNAAIQFLPLYCNKIQMTEKLALYNQKNFL